MKNKDIKDNLFLKTSMYLFNIFIESKDDIHITAIVTCSDTSLLFSKKL